jgi:hypothetical protein
MSSRIPWHWQEREVEGLWDSGSIQIPDFDRTPLIDAIESRYTEAIKSADLGVVPFRRDFENLVGLILDSNVPAAESLTVLGADLEEARALKPFFYALDFPDTEPSKWRLWIIAQLFSLGRRGYFFRLRRCRVSFRLRSLPLILHSDLVHLIELHVSKAFAEIMKPKQLKSFALLFSLRKAIDWTKQYDDESIDEYWIRLQAKNLRSVLFASELFSRAHIDIKEQDAYLPFISDDEDDVSYVSSSTQTDAELAPNFPDGPIPPSSFQWRGERTTEKLRPSEYKLLAYIFERRSNPPTVGELKKQFWPESYKDRGSYDRCASEIRKKLKPLGVTIETDNGHACFLPLPETNPE